MTHNFRWKWLGCAIAASTLVQAVDVKVTRGAPAHPISLSGRWRYTTDGNLSVPATSTMARMMPIPSNWYQQGLDHSGVVWFARAVDVPDDGAWRLEFAGVDYRCEIYWDGL